MNESTSCVKEVDRLASFILKNCPDEINKIDVPITGEGAVDVAIRLISELKRIEN